MLVEQIILNCLANVHLISRQFNICNTQENRSVKDIKNTTFFPREFLGQIIKHRLIMND
jgi:hypothetical protein